MIRSIKYLYRIAYPANRVWFRYGRETSDCGSTLRQTVSSPLFLTMSLAPTTANVTAPFFGFMGAASALVFSCAQQWIAPCFDILWALKGIHSSYAV